MPFLFETYFTENSSHIELFFQRNALAFSLYQCHLDILRDISKLNKLSENLSLKLNHLLRSGFYKKKKLYSFNNH